MKSTLHTFLLLFLVLSLQAQITDTIWTKSMGSSGDESQFYSDVKWSVPRSGIDTSGNVYIVARSVKKGGDVKDSLGYDDCWIIKLNQNGDTLWTKVFGGNSYDLPSEILVMPNGTFYICGYTYSTSGDLPGHHGLGDEEDGFIARFNTNGTKIWAKQYGGFAFNQFSGRDYLNGLTMMSNGDLVAVGQTNSNNGDLYLDFTKFQAAWLLRVNPADGQLITSRKYASANHSEFNSNEFTTISEAPDGSGSYVIGEQHYMLQYIMWVVKLDVDDYVEWDKEFGSVSDNLSRSIIALPNKEALITGNVYAGNGDVSTFYGGYTDIWVAIIDSNKNVIKEKTFGGATGADMVLSLKKGVNNTFLLAGQSYSSDEYLYTNYGSSDFWLINFDSNLDTIWTRSFGGSEQDALTDLCIDDEGNIFCVGTTQSDDYYIHNSRGGRDIFIARFDNLAPLKAKNSVFENSTFSFYPNPTTDYLYFEQKEIKSIEVTNSLGQNLMTIKNPTTNFLDLTNLKSGLYSVKITTTKNNYYQKITKN